MEIGISLACFYPEHPEEAIAKVSDMGFRVCELFLNTMSELDIEYISLFSKTCEKYNLEIYSIHPFTSALENYMFFSPYDRRISDSKLLYQKYCDVAKFLGAKVINIHGDRGLGLNNFEQYCECLEPLFDLQSRNGVILSHENVFFNSVNHPEFVKKLRSHFGQDIKFTFDIKQANKGGSVPYDVCESMGNNIVNFHINDYDKENICLLPGEGSVDYNAIFDLLEKNHYNGPAIIEVYSHNFNDIDQVIRSFEFLKSLI